MESKGCLTSNKLFSSLPQNLTTMKRASLETVAKELGLSKTLVSFVLNGKGDENKISKETQKKVLEKAKELNYQPNRFAQSLRTGKTNIIALIIPDISNAFFSLIAKTIEDEVSKNGYNLVVCNTDEDEKKESDLIDTLNNWNIDGLIVATTMKSPKLFDTMKKTGKSFVLIDRTFEDSGFSSVSVENKWGAELAVKYFVDNKKKNLLMLNISPSHISPIREREEGFLKACNKFKESISSSQVEEIHFEKIEDDVRKIIQKIYLKNISADAIFTANNTLAIAVNRCMKELNPKMREEILLCSFDDIPVFEYCVPPIAAVSQPVKRIGREAANLLLKNIISQKSTAESVTLPVELIIR